MNKEKKTNEDLNALKNTDTPYVANENASAHPPPLKEAHKFLWLKKAFGDEEAKMTGQAAALGITFAVAIVLGLAGGLWLDKKLSTAPWMLLAGILLGVAAGFYNLIRFSIRLERVSKKKSVEKSKAEAYASIIKKNRKKLN